MRGKQGANTLNHVATLVGQDQFHFFPLLLNNGSRVFSYSGDVKGLISCNSWGLSVYTCWEIPLISGKVTHPLHDTGVMCLNLLQTYYTDNQISNVTIYNTFTNTRRYFPQNNNKVWPQFSFILPPAHIMTSQ